MNTPKVSLRVGSMINQCPTCGKVFNSITAFDAHRVGPYSARRCLSDAEMLDDGMVVSQGRWVSKERDPGTVHRINDQG